MARGATISIDGKSSVDQGDGYPHQSLGSKTIRCDLDEAINWFAMKRASESHLTPIPRDVDGVPHRLCSMELPKQRSWTCSSWHIPMTLQKPRA